MKQSLANKQQDTPVETARLLFFELVDALSNELELIEVPSSFLTDTVEQWAEKMRSLDYILHAEKAAAAQVVAEARYALENK